VKRYLSTAGIALLAVLALGVVGVASASAALPEYKTATFPVSFTGTNSSTLKLTLKSAFNTVECSTSKSKGSVANATEATGVTVTYTGCKEATKNCTTSGKAAGEVETKSLKGVLGYLNKTAKEAGLSLKPESGSVFAEFTCEGGALNKVEGCTIGQVTPVNTLSLKGSLTFEENANKNGQKWTKFEGGAECTLKAFGAVASWVTGKEELTFAKEVEVKA
jgi:hypothetical protein